MALPSDSLTMAASKLDDEAQASALDYFGESILEGRMPDDTRWQKGASGNPRGRPVEPDGLTDMLMYRLRKSGAKALADTLISIAMTSSGNVQLAAIQYIYDRIEGKPRQAILNTNVGEPLLISLMRKLHDDQTALEGRNVVRRGLNSPITVTPTEVREDASGSAGADI